MVNTMPSISLLFLIAVLKFNVLGVVSSHLHFKPNYTDALSKSILFFEGQRSGKLPSSQRMKWRKTSALNDGHDVGVDLTGGYYDAGDNVKFNFPMAFSTAVLAWGVIEFGNSMGSELEHAMQAIKWGTDTDYFLKSTSIHNKVFVQIGEPYGDHNCWERPEDMDTNRTTYAVDKDHPGSEVSAEIAAALASSSIAFKKSHPSYSRKLLRRALKVFKFADKYQGNYNDTLGLEVCPFYCDWSGYEDELAWAAAWLYKATHKRHYLDYVTKNVPISLAKKEPNPVRKTAEFGWDNKRSGIYVLMAKELMPSSFASDIFVFQENADGFVCGVLPESQTRIVNYSRGGLIYKGMGSNMQNPTAISLLLLVYSRYLKHTNHIVHCGHKRATPDRLIALAKSQVDYILGKNPLKMSYMVGYGNKFPQKIHHRGSSLPSIDQHPQKLGCKDGTPYFESILPNPNVLVGAVVGGPALNDTYADSRSMFVQSEPTTYINAPLVGPLAFFSSPKRRNLD